jgi:hypothetical protein
LASSAGSTASPSSREPRLDDLGRDERDHHGQEQRAADPEVEVRDEVDLRLGVDQRGRLVGDVGDHRVGRHDQHVDPERRADRAEAGRDPGQRVAPDAQERGRRQRDQHEVAGVGGDARHDPDEHDDVRQRGRRRDRHELADQAADQARELGDADADHRHEDHADGGEAEEVRHERREHEADAVAGQQALDLEGLPRHGVALGAIVVGQCAHAVGPLRGLGVRRRDDLAGHAHVQPVQQLREHDHAHAQREEQDRRVGHPVPGLLDPGQRALREPTFRLAEPACPLDVRAHRAAHAWA